MAPANRDPGGVPAGSRPIRVGVISDTHGLLRPEALRALQEVDHIIHAGDVGDPGIIASLESTAPVTVVRGNMDRDPWADLLPTTAVAEVAGRTFYVLHDLAELDLKPEAAELAAVVSGHTHVPEVRREGGVLYLNPGSAGPVRASKPVTLAVVEVSEGGLEPKIIHLL